MPISLTKALRWCRVRFAKRTSNARLSHITRLWPARPIMWGSGSTSVRVNGILERAPLFAAISQPPPPSPRHRRIIGEPDEIELVSLAKRAARGCRSAAASGCVSRSNGWPLVGFIFMVDDFMNRQRRHAFRASLAINSDLAPASALRTIPTNCLRAGMPVRWCCSTGPSGMVTALTRRHDGGGPFKAR